MNFHRITQCVDCVESPPPTLPEAGGEAVAWAAINLPYFARDRGCVGPTCRLLPEGVVPSPDLFLLAETHPIASSLVVWEACTVLSQRDTLPWFTDADGYLTYERAVRQGRGLLQFRLAPPVAETAPTALRPDEGWGLLAAMDLRAACTHLVYAAHAIALDCPWEQDIILTSRQLAAYLGLDQRKALSRTEKLHLTYQLALYPLHLLCRIQWPAQGKIPAFTLADSPLWHLQAIQHEVTRTADGPQWLGFTLRLRAGGWARHFLNAAGQQHKTAFHQYGLLPQSLLLTVMRIWQQHPGAARMLLWLFFKTRLGPEQAIAVSTLMRVAYGQHRLNDANTNLAVRKRCIRMFERDLEVLYEAGFQPNFEAAAYPLSIQPLWARLLSLPDDSEAELDFWIEDAGRQRRLTDPAPRGKWKLLMQARISGFQLPELLTQRLTKLALKRDRKLRSRDRAPSNHLTKEDILAARQRKGWSQRKLADHLGKSQSWVRDIEKGRLRIRPRDQKQLRALLDLES